MGEEIKEILDFKKNADYKKLSVDEITILYDCITNLQQKVDQYENPDDMTLFYMWLDTKAKDKMKELQEENERLKELNENASKVCIAEHRYGVEKAEEARYYKSRCEYLERSNNRREDEIMSLRDECVDGETYKSRCEKADKFIDNNTHYYSTTKHGEGFSIDLDEEVFCNTLSNILNGGENNE